MLSASVVCIFSMLVAIKAEAAAISAMVMVSRHPMEMTMRGRLKERLGRNGNLLLGE